MSLPRYPEYKPSGVPVLAEVPAHWDVLPIRRDIDFMTSGSRGWADNYADEGELFIRIGNLTRDGIELDLSEVQRVIVPTGVEGSRTKVQPGDVLFSVTADLGSVAVVAEGIEAAYVSQHIALVRLRRARLSPKWVAYSALSVLGRSWFAAQGYGGAKIQLSLDDVKELVVAAPPISEQSAIASFLDRETDKIEALMLEQRRLIDLLREKRQAVISHAVTKGLNPRAPMRPSGIDWVGEVPAHWDCVRNKVVFDEIDERSASDEGELMTVSHLTGVTPRSEKEVNMFLAETLEGYKMCQKGDLVINTMWAWMGALGCSPCNGLVSPSYNVYRPRSTKRVIPAYYDYLSRIPTHKVAMKANSTGVWESRLRLYPDAFLSMRLAVPPVDEQAAIVEHLDIETDRWDALAEEAELAIDLLQERRAALISAAVTGAIDVRGSANREAA